MLGALEVTVVVPKNLIKVKFCPHLQGERERSVVDGGRQANATSAASDPLLFPTQPFSQDTALLGRELCALAGLVCFPDQPPIPPSLCSSGPKTMGNVNPWPNHCKLSTGRCLHGGQWDLQCVCVGSSWLLC